ncbi:hypothetical protein IJM86_05650 [bacterium]|nr:hypothetical protein [bacterium]
MKGEPAKEVEIHSTIFTGGQIGISYDGVDEIKIESVTVELSGINAKDIKQLDLVKDNTTVTTTNPTDSKITFQIPEGIKLSQGKSPMEFTINGELVKPLADNAKFSFKVVDITAADKDNTQITDTKIDTPDSTRTWVYKASLVKLGVKNKEDFTTGTRKNLALDIFTGELQNVTEANIQDIVLTPQGSAKDKIESINVGGTPFSKQND